MHYYKRNIGDYHKKAGRLSILQHGVYTLLMDSIYDREEFPTLEQARDWIWASSDEEIAALEFVLGKFFTCENGLYVQSRIVEEMEIYAAKCAANAENGKKGGRPKGSRKKTQSVLKETQSVNLETQTEPNRNPDESDSNPNQEPLTTNQDKSSYEDSSAGSTPACPHQQIIEIYHAKLPTCPRVRSWINGRQRSLRTRWTEDPARQELSWWERYFDYVAKSSFLTGKTDPQNGKPPFVADLEWLIKPSNMAKVIEGKYHR